MLSRESASPTVATHTSSDLAHSSWFEHNRSLPHLKIVPILPQGGNQRDMIIIYLKRQSWHWFRFEWLSYSTFNWMMWVTVEKQPWSVCIFYYMDINNSFEKAGDWLGSFFLSCWPKMFLQEELNLFKKELTALMRNGGIQQRNSSEEC